MNPSAQGRDTRARLAAALAPQAEGVRVRSVLVGLVYTAVRLEDDRTGLAQTGSLGLGPCCGPRFQGLRPLAGRPAAELLPLLSLPDPVQIATGLACANALGNTPERAHSRADLLDVLAVSKADHVGMVGLFRPFLAPLRRLAGQLTVFERRAADELDAPGGLDLRPAAQLDELLPECDVAIVSATTLVNGTMDAVLDAAASCRQVAIVGASTPMLPACYPSGRISVLAGVVVTHPDGVMQVVAEAGGTPALKPYVTKVTLRVEPR